MTLEELDKKLTEIDDLRKETDDLRAKLVARIAEFKARIVELKARGEEKPDPPHPRPYPENDQFYYFVNAAGEVNETNWNADHFDLDACEIGNAFLTQAEAEFALERLKVLAEMREWAGDWHDKWRLYYCDGRIEPEMVYIGEYVTYGEMRFATEEDAANCIKAVGKDRLKKYYFGIPELYECCTSES